MWGLSVKLLKFQKIFIFKSQTRPLVVKDHMYEKPIKQVSFNEENNWIISTCSKSMKIWDAETGKAVTAVEPPAGLNFI